MKGMLEEVKDQWKSESDKIDKKLETLIQLEHEKIQLEREKLEFECWKAGYSKPNASGGMCHLIF